MTDAKKNCARAGWALFFFAAVAMIAEAAIELASGFIHIGQTLHMLLLLIIPTYIAGLSAFYLIIKRIEKPEPQEKKRLSTKECIIYITIGFGAMYFFNLIGTTFTMLISYFMNRPVLNPVDVLEDMNIFVVALFAGIAAPFIEEIIYRGLLLGRLKRYGEKNAIIYSALMFGLMHGNFSQFFYAFALGLLLGYIAVRTNDIRYCIALHMIINLCGGVIFPQIILMGSPMLTALLGVLVILFIIAGVLLFAINAGKISFKRSEEEIPAKMLYKNVGTALYILICFAMFAITIF